MPCDCHEFGKILEGSTGHTASCNRDKRKAEREAAKPQKVKTRIKPVGAKMSKKMAVYTKRKKEFIVGKICPIYPHLPVKDIHHMSGRVGDLLLDERFWLAVSRKGHIKITNNPAWAIKNGYSVSRQKISENIT